MTATHLITRSDFAPYVEVATNLSDSKLLPRILEAQTFDLKPLLGVKFYAWLTGEHAEGDAPYSELMPFIKPILVYFSAARLIKSLDLHITPNAVARTLNEYAEHIDTKAIGFKATEYQNLALAYWGEALAFINEKGKAVYPQFVGFASCSNNGNTGYRPKMYGILGRDLNAY